MGIQGASGFKEMFLGSKTEKIVRYLPCPVICLKNDADAYQMKNKALPVIL